MYIESEILMQKNCSDADTPSFIKALFTRGILAHHIAMKR